MSQQASLLQALNSLFANNGVQPVYVFVDRSGSIEDKSWMPALQTVFNTACSNGRPMIVRNFSDLPAPDIYISERLTPEEMTQLYERYPVMPGGTDMRALWGHLKTLPGNSLKLILTDFMFYPFIEDGQFDVENVYYIPVNGTRCLPDEQIVENAQSYIRMVKDLFQRDVTPNVLPQVRLETRRRA